MPLRGYLCIVYLISRLSAEIYCRDSLETMLVFVAKFDISFFFVVHRSTQMASFHSNLHSLQLLLTCFHYLPIFHWLLLSGMMLTLQDLGTYSTEKHPMPPYSKEPRINCRDCFHPLATSLQPHCLLPHGTEWQSLSQSLLWESLRYVCLQTWLLISTHYGTTGQL